MDVLPIPPVPTRAMGVRFSTRPTIFSTNSLRPKNALGDGGGDSPGGMVCEGETVGSVMFETTGIA